MDKNEKEKQLLYEWAVQNSWRYHFQAIDNSKESYFMQRESQYKGLGIREYAFESLPEFMKELDKLWKDDEVMEKIKKAISIAAIKNKVTFYNFSNTASFEEKRVADTETLPMYIYNF